MKSPFIGKFKLESQEHFDDFLAAIGDYPFNQKQIYFLTKIVS